MQATTILDAIPYDVDEDLYYKVLRIKPGSEYGHRLAELMSGAREVARPKVAYRESSIQALGDDYAILDGVTLTSRVLRDNFTKAKAVFPFIATCGQEIEDWSQSYTDTLEHFWADSLKAAALGAAAQALEKILRADCQHHPLSCMNPGSLDDWPLTQHQTIFSLLGDAPRTIGVTLTDHFLLIPLKTISGIYFFAEEHFINCQLCPRENCPGRRAPQKISHPASPLND